SFNGEGFEISTGFDGDDVGIEASLKGDNVKNTLRLGADWDGISLYNKTSASTDKVGGYVKTWTETTVEAELFRLRANMKPVAVLGIALIGGWILKALGVAGGILGGAEVLGGISILTPSASSFAPAGIKSLIILFLSKIGFEKFVELKSSQDCNIS